MLAPIAVFAFNRTDNISRMLDSLSKCVLSKDSNVYLFIDGPRNQNDKEKCIKVKKIAENFECKFRKLSIYSKDVNAGLASSLISGISTLFDKYDRVIVLEDDLIFTDNFLVYMNSSLAFYQSEPKVGSISGFSTPIDKKSNVDVYCHPRPCSWGWGTWKDRWKSCDWEYSPKNYIDRLKLRKISRKAGQDVYRMYQHQLTGKINSWAIRWTIHHLRNNLSVIYPYKSKVKNVGFGDDATHCKGRNPFPTNLDKSGNKDFLFLSDIEYDVKSISMVNYYHSNLYKLRFKLGLNK
ncbi:MULTISPECIES: hypothetical protein [unclassified Vibrio]|uniref:hypothetical protein n=1 Tax=unclassified Vibrio TaxID=2614977 RepID=UPI0020A2E7E9|nr:MULTISPECIES: hypothetical protein [unclassified Vibrio]